MPWRLFYEKRLCHCRLQSYNYLGFADDWHETCRADVMATVAAWPLSLCASFAEGGYTSLHRRLETVVAKFLRKDDAVIFNMVSIRQ